jgi:hypothetical protein
LLPAWHFRYSNENDIPLVVSIRCIYWSYLWCKNDFVFGYILSMGNKFSKYDSCNLFPIAHELIINNSLKRSLSRRILSTFPASESIQLGKILSEFLVETPVGFGNNKIKWKEAESDTLGSKRVNNNKLPIFLNNVRSLFQIKINGSIVFMVCSGIMEEIHKQLLSAEALLVVKP